MRKVNIPKERLVQLYCKDLLTTEQIGNLYNVDRCTIASRLKEYNIHIVNAQRKFQEIKSIPLSKEQIDLIVGSTLGDASIVINGRRKNAYWKVSHCEQQIEYIKYKENVLGELSRPLSKYIDKRGNSVMYTLRTLSHIELNDFHKLFYSNGIKIIFSDLKQYLNSNSLSFWYMDDGHKNRLSTDGFTKEENYLLRDMIHDIFNIQDVKVLEYTRRGNRYYYLSCSKDLYNHLKLIDTMRYKIGIKD